MNKIYLKSLFLIVLGLTYAPGSFAGLDELPPEVVAEIAGHLVETGSPADLRGALLSCSALSQQIAENQKYKAIREMHDKFNRKFVKVETTDGDGIPSFEATSRPVDRQTWMEIMGEMPFGPSEDPVERQKWQSNRCPECAVNYVLIHDVDEFLAKVNQKYGSENCTYDLPTPKQFKMMNVWSSPQEASGFYFMTNDFHKNDREPVNQTLMTRGGKDSWGGVRERRTYVGFTMVRNCKKN